MCCPKQEFWGTWGQRPLESSGCLSGMTSEHFHSPMTDPPLTEDLYNVQTCALPALWLAYAVGSHVPEQAVVRKFSATSLLGLKVSIMGSLGLDIEEKLVLFLDIPS